MEHFQAKRTPVRVKKMRPANMLFALDFASRAGSRVESYEDAAHSVLSPNAKGRLFMSHTTLRPVMVFCGESSPSGDDLTRLHHRTHETCDVAHSLRAEITISPQMCAA